jgi:hypothetical protein
MWVTLENLFKVTLSVVFTAVWLVGVRWVWAHQLDPVATAQRLMRKPFKAPEWVATREPNKIYQNGSVVGEVVGPVQEQDSNSIILFEKLANTGAPEEGRRVSIPTIQPPNTTDRAHLPDAIQSRSGSNDGRP